MEGKEFYYQHVIKEGKPFFLITPKKYYDTEGALLDVTGAANEILPNGFKEVAPSLFSFTGDAQTGTELLRKQGLIFIDFGFTAVKPVEGGDDDLDDDAHDDNDDYARDEDEDEDDEEENRHRPRPNRDLIAPQFQRPEGQRPAVPNHHEDDIDDEDDFEERLLDEENNHPPQHNPINPIPRVDIRNFGFPRIEPGSLPTTPPTQRQQPAPTPLNNNSPSNLPTGTTGNDDLDSLLSEAKSDPSKPKDKGMDYKNMATAALLRHLQVMLRTESYVEAGKIRDELDSRGHNVL